MKSVEEIVEQALNLKPGTIKESDSMLTVKTWDSIGHLEVLTLLDIESGKLVGIRELVGATSVKAIKDVLRARGLLNN